MKNTKFNKATKIITKILEVTHWVGTALLILVAICSLVLPSGHILPQHSDAHRSNSYGNSRNYKQ